MKFPALFVSRTKLDELRATADDTDATTQASAADVFEAEANAHYDAKIIAEARIRELERELDNTRALLEREQDDRARAAAAIGETVRRQIATAQTPIRDAAREIADTVLTVDAAEVARRVAVVLIKHATVLGLDDEQNIALDLSTATTADEVLAVFDDFNHRENSNEPGSCPCGGTGGRHRGGAACRLFDPPESDR